MLRWAVKEQNGPVAIRYPRGGQTFENEPPVWEKEGVACHREGKDVTILTYGTLATEAICAAEILFQKGIEATVLRLQRVDKIPVAAIPKCGKMVVMEEVCANSGIKEALCMELGREVYGLDLGHRYITHGSLQELYHFCGLDGQSVADYILEVLQ